MTVAPPEQGQLVDVRQRRWVVTDVARSALPPDPLRRPVLEAQHLVSLASVEDDCLGEELQVVWELEVANRIHEKVSLPEPTGFDPPARLDAFLDAVRWGAASTADIHAIQAPFRSGIEIEDYQLDPVLVQALEARMRDRTGGLQKELSERAAREEADIRAILTELQKSIQAELNAPEYQQMELFSTPEREQFERNQDALRARVKQIPEEIEKETEAIRQKFADMQPRLFPAAVTYLVPQRVNHE